MSNRRPSRGNKARAVPLFLQLAKEFYGPAFGARRSRALDEAHEDWAELEEHEQTFALGHLLYLNLQSQAGTQRLLLQIRDGLDEIASLLEGEGEGEGDDEGEPSAEYEPEAQDEEQSDDDEEHGQDEPQPRRTRPQLGPQGRDQAQPPRLPREQRQPPSPGQPGRLLSQHLGLAGEQDLDDDQGGELPEEWDDHDQGEPDDEESSELFDDDEDDDRDDEDDSRDLDDPDLEDDEHGGVA